MWRHLPWLLGMVLAPLLLGSVTAEGQVVVAVLFAISLILLAPQLAGEARHSGCRLWGWMLVGLALLSVVPLPSGVLAMLSPERAALAKAFPLAGLDSWQTLSVSPGGSIVRGWELLLVFTGFYLARRGALAPGFPPLLARFVAAGVCLLAASDVWFQVSGKQHLLGIWENRWGTAAGTFANRNHFANWIYVGILPLLGWLLRVMWPMRTARTEPLRQPRRRWPTVLLVALVVLPAAALAVGCGSRAGTLAFGIGLLALAGLVAWRSHSHRRRMLIGGVGLVLFILLVAAGGLVMDRAAGGTNDFKFKGQIWSQSLAMTAKFPIFGVGLGAFAPAFNHYKSMRGDLTFWHAENDWVQLVAELGLAGALLAGLWLCCALRGAGRAAWSGKVSEPELLFGALAGLVAFAVHAVFEFVLQIPATAILAAALLGLVAGLAERNQAPVVSAPASPLRLGLNGAWALVLLGGALAQGQAWRHWEGARAASGLSERIEHGRRALRWWPMAAERQPLLLRSQIQRLQAEPRRQQITEAEAVRGDYLRGLRWDPYNWELRLELAWFDLAFHRDQELARREAWQAVRLNPLQSQIPLRFARHFAARDPASAVAFLEAVNPENPALLRQVLALAWQADRQPATLWALTPATDGGLLTLADFALDRGLDRLAVEACRQLSNRVDGAELARRYLRAGAIELATNALARARNPSANRMLHAQALMQAGQYLQAVAMAEHVWRSSHLARAIEHRFPDVELHRADPPAPMLAALRSQHQAQPENLAAAHALAEALFDEPVAKRDLVLLRQLAQKFPREPRYLWMVLQSELERGNFSTAATVAIQLAEAAQRLR